jgi:hypothetical protein
MAASKHLKEAGKQHQYLATLPIGQPDPTLKKTWHKRNIHGKTDSRALTTAEIAEQDLKLRKRQDKKHQPATPEHDLEEVVGEVCALTIPEQEPPSTAPTRLANEGDIGRGKRRRKMTEAYRQAWQEGLL